MPALGVLKEEAFTLEDGGGSLAFLPNRRIKVEQEEASFKLEDGAGSFSLLPKQSIKVEVEAAFKLEDGAGTLPILPKQGMGQNGDKESSGGTKQ